MIIHKQDLGRAKTVNVNEKFGKSCFVESVLGWGWGRGGLQGGAGGPTGGSENWEGDSISQGVFGNRQHLGQ